VIEIDTYEKSMHMIEILRSRKAIERLALAMRYFPETKRMTHQGLGDFVNISREVVTRTFSKIRKL
jgi:hypothetical protein